MVRNHPLPEPSGAKLFLAQKAHAMRCFGIETTIKRLRVPYPNHWENTPPQIRESLLKLYVFKAFKYTDNVVF